MEEKYNGKENFLKQESLLELKRIIGLPWWRSGWESTCQCRGHGFEPWSGKIPHATEQLGPWATTTEPARLEPVLCNKRGRDSERPAHRDEEWPPLAATGESPCTETKTQHSQKKPKINKIKNFFKNAKKKESYNAILTNWDFYSLWKTALLVKLFNYIYCLMHCHETSVKIS